MNFRHIDGILVELLEITCDCGYQWAHLIKSKMEFKSKSIRCGIIDETGELYVWKGDTCHKINKDIPKESALIQGYTKEQWQEIIDGEYLCEFSNNTAFTFCEGEIGKLQSFTGGSPSDGFVRVGTYISKQYCRPSQHKGVMRPIFIEPMDKDATCHFFTKDGNYCGRGSWRDCGECAQRVPFAKYIEL
jgi:hypothetical protein